MSIPEWAQSLPEELHGAPHIDGAENLEQWVNHLKNDAAWRGQSIRVPGPDADETVMNEFYDRLKSKVPSLMPTPTDDESAAVVYASLGKPDKPKDYKVPEGVELENIEQYKEAAHNLDMTQKVFERWVKSEADSHTSRIEAITEQIKQGYDGLKGEWGAAFDREYGRISNLLADAPDSVKQAYEDKTLPADQVRWLHSLVELGRESSEAIQQKGVDDIMTPEQAAQELSDLQPKFYKMRKSDPGYAALAKKMERLTKLKLGMVA